MRTNINMPKKLLAKVRGGDYAHPGDELAIELVMQHVPKIPDQLLLDVGCGLGGTAKYIKDHSWGIPIGIDIDEQAISHAKINYPDISFLISDVTDVSKLLPNKLFDVIYLFNSSYAFKNQSLAFSELYKMAKRDTVLIICDYMKLDSGKQISSPFAPPNNSFARPNFNPMCKDTIEELLISSGWKIQLLVDIGKEYTTWYSEFLSKLNRQKDALLSEFNIDLYDWAYASYSELLSLLENGVLSGAILIARPIYTRTDSSSTDTRVWEATSELDDSK